MTNKIKQKTVKVVRHTWKQGRRTGLAQRCRGPESIGKAAGSTTGPTPAQATARTLRTDPTDRLCLEGEREHD